MPPEELRDANRREPFAPFRIRLADGRTFDVPRPFSLIVARQYAVVGIYEYAIRTDIPARSETIWLDQIVSLEPLT